MQNWTYLGKELTELPPKVFGFVYLITNLESGRMYIGRKYATKKVGKVRKGIRRTKRVESDWQDYTGSSDELNADILRLGHKQFRREVLAFGYSKGEVNFAESFLQFALGALETDRFYNYTILHKYHKSNVSRYQSMPQLHDVVRRLRYSGADTSSSSVFPSSS
jgi:hypothetical protein